MNNDAVNKINVQLAFVGASVVANSLSFYVTYLYKELYTNPNAKEKYSTKQIYNLGLLAANIFLIVTIYFYISTYDTYNSNPTQANYDYYMASSLSLIAQSIRVNTLIKYPINDINSADIL